MKIRGSGILLHITSLGSQFGIGDLGPEAYRFADFLCSCNQSCWQILPLNVTNPDHYSPYNSPSAFGGNPLLVSPELLVRDGFLKEAEIDSAPDLPKEVVDYESTAKYKLSLLETASERLKDNIPEYEAYVSGSPWLEDFALFRALKSHFNGACWSEWPPELRDRNPKALNSYRDLLKERTSVEKRTQFFFWKQWQALREYCNRKNIQIIGDIPVYVDYDGADVWCNPQLFKLDKDKKPYVVAGVPPDYFSETGQLWGLPIYRWDVLKKDGFAWWTERINYNLKLCDHIRIDHFRGFVEYWEIPSSASSAINGKWVPAPAKEFFKTMLRRFSQLPIIAEDLGEITPDVREVIKLFDFPGMKILLFAFGDDMPLNPYIPHNLPSNCVAYTGTHDTNTVRGWHDSEASPENLNRLEDYLGKKINPETLHWEMIRLVMMSPANMSIFPMQDVLGLGAEARMNFPSRREGNWGWRLIPGSLTPDIRDTLLKMTKCFGRS